MRTATAFPFFVGATCAHPFFTFGELELPQSAELVRGQAFAFSPVVDRALHDTKMLFDLIGGNPRFRVHGFGAPLVALEIAISLTGWHFTDQSPSRRPAAKAWRQL